MVNKIYKGWNVDIYMDYESGITGTETSELVGAAQSVSAEVSASMDPVYGVGHINPQELKQGPREITGSMERMYGDERLWDILDPTVATQPSMAIWADMADGERILKIKGVKLDSWSVDIPQDDFLTESADFTATAITVSGTDVSALELQSSSFECEECGQSFDTERGLQVHARVHEGDK